MKKFFLIVISVSFFFFSWIFRFLNTKVEKVELKEDINAQIEEPGSKLRSCSQESLKDTKDKLSYNTQADDQTDDCTFYGCGILDN